MISPIFKDVSIGKTGKVAVFADGLIGAENRLSLTFVRAGTPDELDALSSALKWAADTMRQNASNAKGTQ